MHMPKKFQTFPNEINIQSKKEKIKESNKKTSILIHKINSFKKDNFLGKNPDSMQITAALPEPVLSLPTTNPDYFEFDSDEEIYAKIADEWEKNNPSGTPPLICSSENSNSKTKSIPIDYDESKYIDDDIFDLILDDEFT
ncbi:hypothetical protein MXB_805 [Myxobolus squamalis]|nr:hypothetical protein MXB_805 [Myxobolus squamalis]